MCDRFKCALLPVLATVLSLFPVGASGAAGGKCREVKTQTTIGIANDRVSISFDSQTGAMVSLKNLDTEDDYLKDVGGDGNPFRAYVDTTQVPKILAVGDPFPRQPIEGALGGKLVDPRNCKLVSSSFQHSGSAGILRLVLRHPEPDLTFDMEVSLPDADIAATFGMTVHNEGAAQHKLMLAFPYLTGLGLGKNRDTNLGLHLQNLGHSRGAAWEDQGDIHGRCWGGQWNAVYEPSINEALGIMILDKDFRNKAVLRHPGGVMSFFYFDNREIKPGDTLTFPAATVLVHRGNWKTTARRYGEWFRSVFKVRQPPKWLDDIDMFVGGWVLHPDKVKEFKSKPDSADSFTSFAQFPRLYLDAKRDGGWDSVGKYDLKEWAQWWQGVIRYNRFDAYHHTDGVYDYRQDLGGGEALKQGIVGVEKIGRVVGLYIASQTVRNDSIFFKDAFPGTTPQDWLRMETPDTKLPPPDAEGQQSFYMCMRNKPYQDYLAALIKRVLKETGAKYIRIDEFGGTYLPCHNPAHHHADPYNSTPEILEFLRKIRAAMDEVNPEAALFTETCCDTCSLYSDGTLSAWYGGPDVMPMRLLFRDYVILAYHSGQIESALNGFITADEYACNRGGFWNPHHSGLWGPGLEHKPKSYPPAEEWKWAGPKMRWHELMDTFIEAARHGDPTDVNPTGLGQDPDEWASRLWRSEKYWLMVCGNVAGIKPASPVRVKLPELPEAIQHAYEFDFETLAMREVPIVRDEQGIFVETINGFSAVFFPKPQCPPLVQMQDPPVMNGAAPMELALTAFAPWRADLSGVEVKLAVPGLKVSKAAVQLPASVAVSAPAEAEGGFYYLHVTGDCLRLKRWFRYEPQH